MAIYSDAGALVGTWWNQVTQPQGPRGPITETVVNPAALTARTDLDEAQQALGKPLPIVIGTGRVDGVYFIGGVETIATVTWTTTTTNDIPEGYQAVSGTMGGQTFLFGPGPRTTTTSVTDYDNRTLAGYVLAYDVFERGYDLIRLEIDGAVVYDAEAGIPETTTFRYYGGRHTTVDPILTQIIGANAGAYQNFVMIFIDGYPADSPPSISAVISNAVATVGGTQRIEWTGTLPVETFGDPLAYGSSYDPADGVIYHLLEDDEFPGVGAYQLAVFDIDTHLERYRVPLAGSAAYYASSGRPQIMALRGTGHILAELHMASSPGPLNGVDRIYDAVTGAIVAEHAAPATEEITWTAGLPFGSRYVFMGFNRHTGENQQIHFGVADIAAGTFTVEEGTIGFDGPAAWGRQGSGSVSFYSSRYGADTGVYEHTFDGTAWTTAMVYAAATHVLGLHFDPETGYLVVTSGSHVDYVNPLTGGVIASFDPGTFLINDTPFSGFERFWAMPGFALFRSDSGIVRLLNIRDQTLSVYTDNVAVADQWTGVIFDHNRRSYFSYYGDYWWTEYRLAVSSPRLIDLEEVITDAMSLAGFGAPNLTFEGIAGRTSYGFVVGSDTTVQAIGRSLSDIYGFSWCDTGSGFFFKQAAQGDLFSIDAAFDTPDIVERDQPVMSQDEANIRTPSSVEMQYVSKEGQYRTRPTSFNMTVGVLNSITTPKFSTPILFDDAEAQRIVQDKFFEYQEKRRSHSLAVAPEHITLLPGDIVSFPSGTRTYITRVEEVGIDLRNMGVEISARDFQTDVESPITEVSNTGPVWQVVYHASGNVTGQTLAVSVGTVTVTAGGAGAGFANVTGQSMTTSVGAVTVSTIAGGSVSAAVSGQEMTASVGTVSVTTPAVGDPYFNYVVLLIGANGTDASTTFTDESLYAHAMTAGGNAQIDTAQFKFGTASALFDGAGDYLTTPDSADWDFGSGRFTVEAWVRFNAHTGSAGFASQMDNSASLCAWLFGWEPAAGGALVFDYWESGTTERIFTAAWVPTDGVWYHVAADRDATGKIRLYVDGVMKGSATFPQTIQNSTKALSIGRRDHTISDYMNGWLDEIRITKGIARYASDSGYTVPALAFSRTPTAPSNSVGPTILGGPLVGATMSIYSTWLGSPTSYTYAWNRDGVAISGATAATYLVVSADIGTTITVTVTATNTVGSTTVTSAGLGPVVTSWAPTALTGMLGWWDAKVTASISLTGADIDSVADQSGAGRTMNWTGYAKPKYDAAGFNSQPAIVFNATLYGNAMQVTSFPMGTGNTLTFWWVGRANSADLGNEPPRILCYTGSGQSSDTNNANSWSNYYTKASQTLTIARNSPTMPVVSCSVPNNTNHRIIGTIDSSGVQTLYVNGVPFTLATSPGNWTSPGTLEFGRNNATNDYWGGPVGEAGVASGYSDATAVALLDNYLKTKWGL